MKSQGPIENLSRDCIKLLTPDNPQTPVFYTLPKIHKPQRPPPGRPIVSSCGSPTERISALVDENLQPLVVKLNSHIKDTFHFIEELKTIQQPLSKDTLLVTVDVESLYTNICHEDGLAAMKYYLDQREQLNPSTDFLITIAKKVLMMNAFRFQDSYYLQKKGTAMGTRMAPSYANLFMGMFETNFLASQTLKPTKWLRFIDDIFFIWEHGTETVDVFLNSLNSFSSLKFVWNISRFEVSFLDVDVFIEEGLLKTKIHLKPTNTMQYLHADSCHPLYVKKSIPKSLNIRAERLCSKSSDLNSYKGKLNTAFKNRGYSNKLLNNQFSQKKNQHTTNTSTDPKFITKFYPGLHKINSIMRTAFPILESSPSTSKLFSRSPRVIFSKPNNLKNILSRPKLPPSDFKSAKSGCTPCKKPRCGTCKIMTEKTYFESSETGQRFPINGNIDCNTKNAIYKLDCKCCQKQYVGQTSNHLRIRMTGHRFSIFHEELDKPVAKHALQHHNKSSIEDCYKLTGLKKFKDSGDEKLNRYYLKRSEEAHQIVLKSKNPTGLNLR